MQEAEFDKLAGVAAEEEKPMLELTPEQKAEDIKKRQDAFNVEMDALCKKYEFAITVVRQDMPNGFAFNPQLMDTKYLPKMPANAGPEVKVVEKPVEAPVAGDRGEVVDPTTEPADPAAVEAASKPE